MTGTFRLGIELGNDAMQTPEDVADALRDIADRIERGDLTGGGIRDENGNTVGSWDYEPEAFRTHEEEEEAMAPGRCEHGALIGFCTYGCGHH